MSFANKRRAQRQGLAEGVSAKSAEKHNVFSGVSLHPLLKPTSNPMTPACRRRKATGGVGNTDKARD